jgi:hypothetical protein
LPAILHAPAILSTDDEVPRLAKTETFAVNDRVSHADYGLGKIIEVDARITTINFDTAGVRKFLTAMMRLERSDSPNPPKPSRARAKTAKAPKEPKAPKAAKAAKA